MQHSLNGFFSTEYPSRLRDSEVSSAAWPSAEPLDQRLFPSAYPPSQSYRFDSFSPHGSSLHPSSVFQRDRPHLAPPQWSEGGWSSAYLDSFYDFNDVNHSFYGLDDQPAAWDGPEDFWVNVPSQPTSQGGSQPTSQAAAQCVSQGVSRSQGQPPPRNVFGFSDSTYLGPLDCEGMSYFNSSRGIYAPRPSFLKSAPAASAPATPATPGLSVSSSSSDLAALAPPPVHLSALWREPVYRRIWESFDAPTRQRLLAQAATPTADSAEVIKKRVEQGILEKKNCHIQQARAVFVELVVAHGDSIQVWLEFCRLEMECGDYLKARCVLETACAQHPHNEVLLQKRLRVEERLRSVNNVILIINELNLMDTQKSVKIMVEGVTVLSKLGYEKMANQYRDSLSTASKYFTGNLYLELMLNEQRSGELTQLVAMIHQALVLFPKYGPLWFFCFALEEHMRFLQWDRQHLRGLLRSDLDEEALKAVGNLTSDLLWRVFLMRIESWFRSIMYMREVTNEDVSPLLLCHT